MLTKEKVYTKEQKEIFAKQTKKATAVRIKKLAEKKERLLNPNKYINFRISDELNNALEDYKPEFFFTEAEKIRFLLINFLDRNPSPAPIIHFKRTYQTGSDRKKAFKFPLGLVQALQVYLEQAYFSLTTSDVLRFLLWEVI